MLVARDRIALLLDAGSAFLELGAFAGYELKDSSPCANLIAGIGSVRYVRCMESIRVTRVMTKDGGTDEGCANSGRSVLILSHIPTQSGGAWNEYTGKQKGNKSI